MVDAGSVHGIPQPHGEESSLFAIFPFDSDPLQWRDMKHSLGTARVQRVCPDKCIVGLSFVPDERAGTEVFKAILVSHPLRPLGIVLCGVDQGLTLVRDALTLANPTGGASLVVQEAQLAHAELSLSALGGEIPVYRIERPADGQQLVADLQGHTPTSAAIAVTQLEHIAKWVRISELSNPGSSLDGEVSLEIYQILDHAGDEAKQPIRLDGNSARLVYTRDGQEQWKKRPRIRIKVVNCSDRSLYCAVLGLTQTYAVETGFIHGGSARLEPGQEAWAFNGKAFETEVPDVLWKHGIAEAQDMLKLIASTEEFDISMLQQGDLDHPGITKSEDQPRGGLSLSNSLERIIKRVQSRGFVLEPEREETIADWTTLEYTLSTLRPQESVPICSEESQQIYPGVRVLGHASFRADARLTSAHVASRDLHGGLVLPQLLREYPHISTPFLMSSSRCGEPGLSVLELHNVIDANAVTPEQPLRLQIDQQLGQGEFLLSVAHDGEFFLPIGFGKGKNGSVEVALNALPKPQNTRSLLSAIKIYFQKVISEKFGTQYNYPLLAAFETGDVNQAGNITDPEQVKHRVQQAQCILLYVHGIIGDTKEMAASSAGLSAPRSVTGVADRYDLLLTFDYENLETPIEETARLLKQRLEGVGLAEGHGKTLHIISHSMGGLVSRWFIEREGGNQIVQHLLMAGTPNGGSPWPTIEDWALSTLSLGLNNLVPIPWLGKTLAYLVELIEKIDVALDQMHPSSNFLKSLQESPDPQIPYTILAGNTTLLAEQNQARQVTTKKLLGRLKNLKLLHLATAPLFFGEPNDIAVSVANICKQPAGRVPEARIIEVPCDHLTYFNSKAGLEAIHQVLTERL